MRFGSRSIGLTVLLAGLLIGGAAKGQGVAASRAELSDAILVDEADASTRTHLDRAKAFVADEQWDEAVEILRQVAESHGGKVLPVSPLRFVSVRDYCHLQLASLPAEALALYRSRVDIRARQWYDDGVRRRDASRLREVVDQLFCSSWGDDALLALGDLAFEAGDGGVARGYWERILPPDYWAKLAPGAGTVRPVQPNGSPVWLVYPDSDVDRAAVRARLLLVRIFDGDRAAARRGLSQFRRDCPDAEGKLAGQQVNYADYLEELLSQSSQWPAEKVDRQWPTFAGSPQRTKVVPDEINPGAVAWEAALSGPPTAEATKATGIRGSSEMREQVFSCHPVVLDNMLLVSTLGEIRAYDLATGDPLWGDADGQTIYRLHERGEIYAPAGLGVPRFTLTVRQRRVYARLGSPVTTRAGEPQFAARHSYLVCVDLDTQGKCLWSVRDTFDADGNDLSWAFEGSPVVDGDGVYVAMRRSGVRPQQYIACLHPETGKLKWRRLVCGAETTAIGQEEITHNLLALNAGTLYSNTNLGAVAALDTRDGHIRWITRYPRAPQNEFGRRARQLARDLTPCVYHNGMVYVAPADSDVIMALDAPTGLFVLGWQTSFPEDVVHLLGVVDGKLVASGDKLWWIDALSGKIVSPPGMSGAVSFPEGGSPKGVGRGLLAGHRVYWPTWDKIYIFDHKTNRQLDPINLELRHAAGGNLISAGRSLIIAGQDRLTVFHPDTATKH